MRYYKITNADGKQWVMPSLNMRVGMLLYQPIAWKGVLLKRWFPYLHQLSPIRRILHIESTESPVSPALDTHLHSIFGERNLEYSYFGGTPCVHQKATIQVYRNNRILGYCKTTKSPNIVKLFQHEELVLRELEQKGVSDIPRCLYCGEWKENEWLFAQTTVKSLKSSVHHDLGNIELNFLKQFNEKTVQTCCFEDTEQYFWLQQLRVILGKFENDQQQVINAAIDSVIAHLAKRGEGQYTAYHSDFTPWNSFVEAGRLFVFDFEYAGLSYIPYLDLFHFYTQTGIFERKEDAEGLYAGFLKKIDFWLNYHENPAISYMAYLLDQLAKFVGRENDELPESLLMYIRTTTQLLELLKTNEKK